MASTPIVAATLSTPNSLDLQRLLARIAEGTRDREIHSRQPLDAMDLVREAKLGALRVPVELGGAGASVLELFDVVIALSEADPHLAHSLRSHAIFVEQRLMGNDPEVEAKWLERIVSGQIFGNATTELGGAYVPGANRFSTRVARTESGSRLNGEKFYSTGVLHADWISVTASDDDDHTVNVVVPVKRDGIEIVDDWDGIGQQLTGSGTTRFVDVQVHEDEVIFDRRFETTAFTSHVNTLAQLWLQAVMAGILRTTVTEAVDVVGSRARNFQHGLAANPAEDPLLQETLGRIASASFAVDAIVSQAAAALGRAVDSLSDGRIDEGLGHEAALAAAQAKIEVDRRALEASAAVFDLGGASAVRRSRELDRHWRNIRTLASHNPASYKARAVGAFHLSGQTLPSTGFF